MYKIAPSGGIQLYLYATAAYLRTLCMYVALCILLLTGACKRQQTNATYVPYYPNGIMYASQIAKQLALAKRTEDSLTIIAQAISNYADDGLEGHINNRIWHNYSFVKKLHLCATDSVKLLCSSCSDLLIDAIHAFTPWRALAYSYGASDTLSHVSVLVDIRGKLARADPYFGYIMYDASADTLLDVFSEINFLKQGWLGKLKYKQVDFTTDFLVCDDSASIAKYAERIDSAIGAHSEGKAQIISTNGICPYKLKVQMTIDRWVKLPHGGASYVNWLQMQGYGSIDYLVMFPLSSWTAPNTKDAGYVEQYYRKLWLFTHSSRAM